VSVNLQQADRDFNIAEFYRRSGHPGSAYFYYELVIRRYPKTDYAEKAAALKNAVRDKVVQEQGPAAVSIRSPIERLQSLFGPGNNSNPGPAPQTLPIGLSKS
jgi:hypothetical protein